MHTCIKSLLFILVIFSSIFITPVSTKAASFDEIIITNEVKSLKPILGQKQLRIVDNNGLILITKAKITKAEVPKIVVKETAKVVEKKIEAKPEIKVAVTSKTADAKVENKPETKTDIKPKTPEINNSEVKPIVKADVAQIIIKNDSKPDSATQKEIKTESANTSSVSSSVKTVDEVKDLIRKTALKYEVDPDLMLKLASCESEFRSDVVTSGRYYGVYQFSKATFVEYSNKMNIPNADPLNPEQNIEVAAYMIQNGQLSKWGCKV
jgi:hypothetical protein